MRTNAGEISENRPLSAISISSIRKLLPRSISTSKQQGKPTMLQKSRQIVDDENSPPLDPNIEAVDAQGSLPIPKKLLAKRLNPLQESKSVRSEKSNRVSVSPDPAVKVMVRIRPVNAHEKDGSWTVRKLSDDSLIVGDRSFSFNSVFDSNSKQEDIFEQVGLPLVKDALAGYNASILSYGQSGSGKTYTMWGPPSAMVEGHSPSTQQGLGPRIFKMLFTEIQKIKQDSGGKQINYQCRCSFLEIYNGQLGDLLDPTQRNLQIKDDTRNGFYIESLTEEYVTSNDDVTHILIKGLSNRKVGATSVNAKSSRSHVVFTCVIESWCKDTPSNSFGSSKTSRISLVDLAGLDSNKQESGRELGRQDKHVKKSLSQLGHLISILAKGIPPEERVYRNSCLTHLLQDSLGGNAKLSLICNISPNHRNAGETLSTLRFGQQVRCVTNNPVINEITEDDVNDLSDQIRQLKEELIKAKIDSPTRMSNPALFRGRSVRESVNQLRISLNRSLVLPHVENDHEEEVTADEVDVKDLCRKLDELNRSCEASESLNFASARGSCDTYFTTEHETNCLHESENEEVNSKIERITKPHTRSVSISSCHQSVVLEDPALSESPKISCIQRKSTISPSILSENQTDACSETPKSNLDVSGKSVKQSEEVLSCVRSSRNFSGPTESLAASLKRGLEIIDRHQRNSASKRTSVAFSFEHLMLKPSSTADKVNASVQTLSSGQLSIDGFVCKSCRQKVQNESDEVRDSLNICTAADSREKELENVCNEQAAKIEELTLLVQQLQQEKNNSSVLTQSPEIIDKDPEPEVIKEACEVEELDHKGGNTSSDTREKEELLKEIQSLRSKLEPYTNPAPNMSIEKLRSSLLSRSFQLRKSMSSRDVSGEELQKERERWTEMESEWINITDELRIDLECSRQRAEKAEMELRQEKQYTEELDDALHRAVLGHARFTEHYVELQEKYDDLAEKHRRIAEYIADVKKAVEKAGGKGRKGSRFAKALTAELSATRKEKDKERERLKKENKSLRIQLRDTAEAVHTAGELLVRLREAEESASVAEANLHDVQQENEKLRMQIEKLKSKHKTEMSAMKQFMAESRLPQSALKPMHFEDSEIRPFAGVEDDDQAWRAEFGAIYQEHLY